MQYFFLGVKFHLQNYFLVLVSFFILKLHLICMFQSSKGCERGAHNLLFTKKMEINVHMFLLYV